MQGTRSVFARMSSVPPHSDTIAQAQVNGAPSLSHDDDLAPRRVDQLRRRHGVLELPRADVVGDLEREAVFPRRVDRERVLGLQLVQRPLRGVERVDHT